MKKLIILILPLLFWIPVNAATYGTITATTAATSVLVANKGRAGVMICNDSTAKIYIGLDSSLTTANGIPVAANGCFSVSGSNETWNGTFYAITTTGTADVRYLDYGVGDVH